MKYTLLAILISSFVSFMYCGSEKDSMTIEGILYSDDKPVSITVVDGKITGIKQLARIRSDAQYYIAPGLIDMQINGYKGVDFSNTDLTSSDMENVISALWEKGVTTILPTVITNEHEHLKKSFELLSGLLTNPVVGMSVPGFHLEGPYISPVKGFRGAHLEKYIRLPDLKEFQEYQQAANNRIMLITVAPEFVGSIPLIQYCADNDVVVALGHHNGSSEEISMAVDAGASMSTHLGNGCANMINRHNNPLWPQLAEDRLSVSLIADGFHLNKEELNTFYKVKGDSLTILVSDALDLAGMPPGEYIRWERTVLLTPDVVKFPAENVLAGAASPVSKCIGNMMKFTGCSLKSAINMATANPARILGLDDRGKIQEGKRADLILFTLEDKDMQIHHTIINGNIVYKSNE